MDINEGILVEYLRGDLDDEIRDAVEKWCDESSDNKKLLEQVYYTMFVSDRTAVMENVDVDKSLNDFKARVAGKKLLEQSKKHKVKQINWCKAISIAAVFAGLVLSVGYIGINAADKYSQSFVVMTKSGERSQAILPDGTKVWLNVDSKVDYHASFFSSERKVTMDGEVYFEVTKDKHAPFIVKSKGIETSVLGTKFNIRANADDKWVTTTLLEGSVLVTASGMDDVKMQPEQQLKINTGTMKAELLECSSPSDYIDWMNGKLHFEEETLKEITNTLTKYYKVNITFADEKLQEQKFTCDFDLSDSIHQILSLLSLTNKFDYKVNDKDIIIVRR